jgi:hypothetical protein
MSHIKKNKRKSPPIKSIPKGYKDFIPGVVLQMDFGTNAMWIKRVLNPFPTRVFESSSSESDSPVSKKKSFLSRKSRISNEISPVVTRTTRRQPRPS